MGWTPRSSWAAVPRLLRSHWPAVGFADGNSLGVGFPGAVPQDIACLLAVTLVLGTIVFHGSHHC